jgi:Ca2+-transporting ATPase
MITGDHPVTAHAVAEGLDLPHTSGDGEDVIATGADLDAADDEEFDRLVARANVFARIRPEQKHRLVRALRKQGEVVAMTGDGINDAPALREADIGVAMGARGTAVARESATMVLLDDNFATIVTAVRDGRRIFDNLQRAFAYLVGFHVPLLVAAIVVPFLGKPLLLLPVHLVLLEIVLHPAVSLVFEADPAAPDTMRRPPRSRATGFVTRALWRPLLLGTTLTGATLGTYLVASSRQWGEERARGSAFCLLLVGQMLLLVVERSPERPLWRGPRPTRTLLWVVALFVATISGFAYVAPLANLLRIDPPSPLAWLALVALAAASTLWSEPIKRRLSPR